MSTVTVTSTADFSDANLATITMSRLANPTFNPDGQISLREAIRAARNTSGADTVELPAGTYLLGGAQLLYDTTAISNAVTIRAAGAAGSAIVDAQQTSRILEVAGSGPVTLEGLTLRNGGGVDRGGAIVNDGALTLVACTLADNTARGADGVDAPSEDPYASAGDAGDALGGAIYSTGALTLVDSTLSGNVAVGGQGGTAMPVSGSAGGHGGDAFGGAIYNTGTITATRSAFTDNAAGGGFGGDGGHTSVTQATGGDGFGGAIYNATNGDFRATDCDLSANRVTVGAGGYGYASSGGAGAGAGGAVYNAADSQFTLAGSTVAGNFVTTDTSGAGGEDGPDWGPTLDSVQDALGGGIFNNGLLTATNTSITVNAAYGGTGAATDSTGQTGGGGLGGGVYNDATGQLNLSNVTIERNEAIGGAGGAGLMPHMVGQTGAGSGGGVFNSGELTLSTATILANSATTNGGGIFNSGSLQVAHTTVQSNDASRGGGIDNAGTATIRNSTVAANDAGGADGLSAEVPIIDGGAGGDGVGGGMANSGVATILNSTVANNTAGGGAGGDAVMDGTSGAGGDGIGGGLANTGGAILIVNSTFAGNTASGGLGGDGAPAGKGYGGGIDSGVPVGNGMLAVGDEADTTGVRLSNSIVAANTAGGGGADVHGHFISGPNTGGFNLVGNAAGSSGFVPAVDLLGGAGNPVLDAKLGPLADNGGPTKTMALLAGSPALGAGAKSLAADASGQPLITDQRGNGFARVVGTAVDIGAFEDQRATASITGTIFYDRDHDGVRDVDDVALSGWTAYVDVNDNGLLDAGEPSAVAGADGGYAIGGLAAGRYARVRELRPDGWTRTLPAGEFPLGYYDLSVDANATVAGRDFGNFKTTVIPPSAADDVFTTPFDTPATLNVLSNDAADIGFDPASVVVIAAPANGTASVDPSTGRITYTPSDGFVGDDTFTYTVKNLEGVETNVATVAITVDPPATLEVTIAGDMPAEVVGGTKIRFKQAVTVRNLTDQRIDGPVTLTIYTSTDETLCDQDVVIATKQIRRLRLKPFASQTFGLRIDGCPMAPHDQSYWLIAQARGDAGYSAPARTEESIFVAAPFADLVAAFATPLPQTLRAGGKGVVRLTVENQGNVAINDRINLSVTASPAATPADPPVLLAQPTVKVKLNPGASRRYRVRLAVPEDLPTGPALVATVVDADDSIAERDEANNSVSATTEVV